jgi:hypothetical protein
MFLSFVFLFYSLQIACYQVYEESGIIFRLNDSHFHIYDFFLVYVTNKISIKNFDGCSLIVQVLSLFFKNYQFESYKYQGH